MHEPPRESQTPSRSFVDELRQLLRLGLPIALVQLGMTALNFVDLAMLGHHDEASLPAMALGNTLAWGAMVFCMGAVTAIDPLLSQAVGARDRDAVPRLLGRGLMLAVLLALPAAALLLPAATWLEWCQQPPALIPAAANYARLQALAVLPFLWYSVLRSFLSAHARIWPQLLTIVAGNLANAFLDWVLIFGKFGAPAMGATGAALATVFCRWLMLFGLLWFGWRDLGPPLRELRSAAVRSAAFALQPLWRLLRLGAPIGAQFLLEMGVFGATALLIGNLDAKAGTAGTGPSLAGHQIALQLASLSFMVPLGLGIAASVRVGWAIGRGDHAAVRRATTAALWAGAVVMSGFMLLFLLAPRALAGLMTAQPEHLAMAALLIPIAGVFQIGDGIQVVAIGCLRGLGDVRSPMLANVLGFWVIGLPLGCWLAFDRQAGPAGFWWGLVVGLFVVAAGLLVVLRLHLRRQQQRLVVE
ncbi:MAG: MATE family efflux transporter [Planctomycetes bacterium]|jgi:MATE family multidrug resistance protein|nr:MATE family efflux transporter [Planctomycetota bacterium]